MRTVVITGSASGIGAAAAAKAKAAGDRVIGVDLHDADINVDLTTEAGRTEMITTVREMTDGKIDAIIANAGLATPLPITVGVNVFGAIATLEGLRPMLAGSAAPRAVITSSMATLQGSDADLLKFCLAGEEERALARAAELQGTELENLIYSTSKVAITQWMRSVASTPEWAGAGIPLNAIGPGVVATAMTAQMTSTEEARAGLLQIVPMPLNGIVGPEGPADLLTWLVSVENTHLCGQLIFIDGGYDVVTRGAEAY